MTDKEKQKTQQGTEATEERLDTEKPVDSETADLETRASTELKASEEKDQPKAGKEPDDKDPISVEQDSEKSSKGWLKVLAGAIVPVIIAGLFLLHNAGIIDLGQYSGFMQAINDGTPIAPALAEATVESIEVYFTTPQSSNEGAQSLDQLLAADIAKAQTSIDVAAYEFDLETVADALLEAKEQGVKVRLVTDTDNTGERAVRNLKRAGIPVIEDDREPIMHNKFVVIDGNTVWTGSWNLTENGTFRNDNNAVRIVSELIAENYTTEFEEMFVDGEFGPTSPDKTPHRHVQVAVPGRDGTVHVETYFAPEDQVAKRLRELIKDAKKSVRFMAFSFTHDKLGQDIKKQDKAGLTVQGVFEDRGSDTEFSEYGMMTRARPPLDVLVDGNPYIMHHKVIIIDDEIVVLGSYNFSENAEEMNDENLIIIHDPQIAALYLQEFERVYQQAAESDQ